MIFTREVLGAVELNTKMDSRCVGDVMAGAVDLSVIQGQSLAMCTLTRNSQVQSRGL
jgi:hypothetical protein